MRTNKEMKAALAKAKERGKKHGDKLGNGIRVTRVTTIQGAKLAGVYVVEYARATKAAW